MRASVFFASLFFCLIASNPALAQPFADFTANKTEGCGSLAGVQFTNLSTGGSTSYEWDFGNTNTSTLKDPVANYTAVGIYDVRLIAINGSNRDTLLKKGFIKVYENPTADFVFTPPNGCSPLTVTFTNTSTPGDTTLRDYKWDFADGSLGNVENPVHIYQSDGTFPVSLEVIDHNGCSDFTTTTNVLVNRPPRAQFAAVGNPVTCEDSLLVEFLDNSQGNNLSYRWFFGDGDSSNLPNPIHLYKGPGRFDVTLIVSDPNCSDTLLLEEYVRLEETLADFSLPKKDFCIGEPIKFTNNSSGSSFYTWNFGDGTTSSAEEPTKAYADSGTYVIKLTAFVGPCAHDTTDTIRVHFIKADFAILQDTICQRSDTTVFINKSVNADSMIWKIEVGGTVNRIRQFSMPSLPQFNFPYASLGNSFRNGVFDDTLIVINRYGCRDTLAIDSNRVVDELILDSISYDPEVTRLFLDTNGIQFVGGCFPIDFDFFPIIRGPKPIASWDWDFDNGTTSNVKLPPTVTYADDSTRFVRLTIRNNLGCESSGILPILLGTKQNPGFSISIPGDTICPTDTVFITNLASDTNKIQEYQYTFFSSELNQVFSTDSGDVEYTNIPDTGYFTIRQKIFSNGCDTMIEKDSLFYVDGPIATFKFFIKGDCDDRTRVNFESELRGVTRFYWDFGDGVIDSTNQNPVHIFPKDSVYKVKLRVYNDGSICDSLILDTQVDLRKPIPPLIVIDTSMHELNRRIFCVGDSALFTISNLFAYDSLRWFMNGVFLEMTDSILFHFDSVGNQVFELRAIDGIGCEATASDSVYISDVKAGFDTSIVSCQPFELEYIDTSLSDTTINFWFWVFDRKDTVTTSSVLKQYTVPGDKDVYLFVENSLGCKDSIDVEDFVNVDLIEVSFRKADLDLCVGDTMTFRNTSLANNVQFQWDFGDGTVLDTNIDFVKHQYNQPGVFTVSLRAFADNGCVIVDKQVDLIQVDSFPIAGFFADTLHADCVPFEVSFADTSKGNVVAWDWNFGDTASSILEDPKRTYNSVGEFDVFLKVTSPNGCSDSLTKPAYIKIEGPTGEYTIDKDTVCINEPVTFRILNLQNTDAFLWAFGDGNSSSDSITVHRYDSTGLIRPSLILIDTVNNCDIPYLDEIYVFDVKSDFTVSTDSGCTPFNLSFTKASRGDNSFLWRFGQGSTSTEENPSFSYTEEGSYRASLEISSDIGCRDTAYQDLVALPNPDVVLSADTGICIGDSVLLVAAGGHSYTWAPNRDLIQISEDSVIAFPDSSTDYVVRVSNEFNCVDSAQMRLTVQQVPSYSGLKDTSIIIGEEVQLDVLAGIGFNYKWRPAEGLSCTNCPNPIAQPLSSRQYIVDIWDNFGCFSISDTINFEVEEVFTLDVPTAFSPNKDGVNDIIYARGFGLKELIAFKIYNRFGELVFESNDFDRGWDGTYRGEDQNIETYIFTVEAMTFGGKILSRKGNITLLR